MTEHIFPTILLIALPASGKSEVRKYLECMPLEKRINDFHMGETVQLDDFPYVHIMRCIDVALEKHKAPAIFFQASDKPFQRTEDWGTLIELVNEDYFDLVKKKAINPSSAAEYMFERIDEAGAKAGLPKRLSKIDAKLRKTILHDVEEESLKIVKMKQALQKQTLAGKTLVIEFARGGPQGSTMPLAGGYGYQYSLAKVAEPILEKAVALYLWVTPEESRRKNFDRNDPNDPGSILHHGVPIDVMLGDYGCDDIEWLEQHASKPGTVEVKAHGKTFHVPLAKFDNRVDATSFLRGDPSSWDQEKVAKLHSNLKQTLAKLAKLYFK